MPPLGASLEQPPVHIPEGFGLNQGVDCARLWEPPLSGIELFHARLMHHEFGKHFHETYTVGINDSGRGRFMCEGESYDADPQRFNLINPGAVHTGQAASDRGWNFRNLYISVPLVEQVLTQLEWRDRAIPYFRVPTVGDEPLQARFCQLFQALSQPGSPLEIQSLLLEFLAHLFHRHAEIQRPLRSPQPESKAVALVRAYLEAHYAESIAIDTLSQLVNLSPYYLIRCFRQQVGLPPHRYQQNWQLLQAKRSLRTAKPLSEIAAESGFYDQSHLNRIFKRAFGIPPGQYQRNFIQYGTPEPRYPDLSPR